MNRKQRVAHLVTEVLSGVAQTAGNEAANGSEYIYEEAARIGAGDDEVQEAGDQAERMLLALVKRRRTKSKRAGSAR